MKRNGVNEDKVEELRTKAELEITPYGKANILKEAKKMEDDIAEHEGEEKLEWYRDIAETDEHGATEDSIHQGRGGINDIYAKASAARAAGDTQGY
jgi:hypothetical protein